MTLPSHLDWMMTMTDLADRRANPTVDRYVTTDLPLQTILRRATSLKSPLASSLLALLDGLAGRAPSTEVLKAARATSFQGSDPELMVLFLSSWAELSCRTGNTPEAEQLLRRARLLFSATTHPEIRATCMAAEGILADTTGNKVKREQILRETLNVVPSHSPRRKYHVWEFALCLAQQGRATECRSDLREISWQCTENFPDTRIHIVYLVDAVETGRLKEASELMPQIAKDLHQVKDIARVPWRYEALLRLMQSCTDPSWSPESLRSSPPGVPNWLKVLHSLLLKSPGDALKLARLEAGRLMGSIFGSGFDSFNLIRAELSAGRWEAARHLLKMRHSRGNLHYIDDFFLARVELLGRKKKTAAACFAALLNSVERYQAGGRLDFEVRLSCDLSTNEIVGLSRSAEKLAKTRASSPPSPISEETESENEILKPDAIVGRSTAILEIRDTIIRFADLDAPILVTGETGTGKELVARTIHAASRRRTRSFVAVNCGSITDTLLESELFGHERGAFTGADRLNRGLFEEAGTGTIFLDEIGDISPHLQTALLRVLETGEIRSVGSTKTRQSRCRILAATNSPLRQLAEQGRFRMDLLYRLERLCIHIPPLRERPDDSIMLARHFLDAGRPVGTHATMSSTLREAMRSYSWPGNVRELKNVIERMRLLHSDKLSYEADDLDIATHSVHIPAAPQPFIPSSDEPAMRTAASRKRAEPTGVNEDRLLKHGRSPMRRLQRLRKLFEKHHELTRNEIISILDVSPNTATKDLRSLCDEGYIERIEPSASSRSFYFSLKKRDSGQ